MREQPLLLLLLALPLPAQAQPAPAATTRLEGLVLDPLSQPVANARITVEVDGEVVARTQTDGLGTFVVGKVPPRAVIVRATTAVPDVGATQVDLFGVRCGFARLHVMPARQIAGTVRDAAGKPIAGAWVVCTPRGNPIAPLGAQEPGFVGSHTESDAEGRYVLTHVPFGRIALRAWSARVAGFATDVEGTADATVDCTLPAGTPQQRSFEIVDASQAQIAAAQIHVSAWADGAELLLPPRLRDPALDAKGRREVRGWPLADEIRASVELANACVVPLEARVEADLPDILNHSFRFAADDVAFVHGRVTGEDAPTAGVQVVAETATLFGQTSARRTTGTTAADGTFTLTAPVARDGAFQLRCLDPEYVLCRTAPQRGISSTQRTGALQRHKPERHELVLRRAKAVRVDLRDKGGAPVVGAVVTLVGPGVFGSGGLAQGHSGVDGRIELLGLDLREGESLTCQVRAQRGALEHPFTVTNDRVQDLGTLSLGPAAALHVSARTAAGGALAGARIQIQSKDWLDARLVATDRDGNCRLFGLLSVPYDVRIAGQPDTQQGVVVTTGEVAEVVLTVK